MNLSEILTKSILVEIIQGYSFYKDKNLYVKHLDLFDQYDIEYVYKEAYEKYVDAGAPTEQELEKVHARNGDWTQNEEGRIVELEEFIDDLKTSKTKHFQDEYRKQIDEEIKINQNELQNLLRKKNELFSGSSENLALRKTNDIYVLKSFFKDKNFTHPIFSVEKLNEAEDPEIFFYVGIHNKILEGFNELSIKKIAVSGHFQSLFRICENPENFFRKPIVELTFYQNILLSYGVIFKNIFLEHGSNIPKDIRDNPDEVLDFVDQKREIEKRMANKPKNTQFFGLSQKTRENLGLKGNKTHSEQLVSQEAVTQQDLINRAVPKH